MYPNVNKQYKYGFIELCIWRIHINLYRVYEQKQEIFWDYDNHYNLNGYKLISKEIAKFISLNLEN